MEITSLKDKLVVITGAASGIGLECARSYASRGTRLVLLDLTKEALDDIKIELTEQGTEVFTYGCDISDETRVNEVAVDVLETAGTPDVLLNNAGIGYIGKFLDTTAEIWRKVVDVNLMGPVIMSRAFLPAMLEAGTPAKIVNVTSAAGFLPPPSMTPYAATKAGVVGFSECLAMELYDTCVNVMMVAPGIINTNIVKRNAFLSDAFTDEQLERLQKHYSQKGCLPTVVAEDIVNATCKDILVLPTGPTAALALLIVRLSRRLARWFAVKSAPKMGYL